MAGSGAASPGAGPASRATFHKAHCTHVEGWALLGDNQERRAQGARCEDRAPRVRKPAARPLLLSFSLETGI